jgi:hypothetical protein
MACSVVAWARTEFFDAKKVRAAHPIGRIDHRQTPGKKNVFLIKRAHDYKIVINGKTFFQGFRLHVGKSWRAFKIGCLKRRLGI